MAMRTLGLVIALAVVLLAAFVCPGAVYLVVFIPAAIIAYQDVNGRADTWTGPRTADTRTIARYICAALAGPPLGFFLVTLFTDGLRYAYVGTEDFPPVFFILLYSVSLVIGTVGMAPALWTGIRSEGSERREAWYAFGIGMALTVAYCCWPMAKTRY